MWAELIVIIETRLYNQETINDNDLSVHPFPISIEARGLYHLPGDRDSSGHHTITHA